MNLQRLEFLYRRYLNKTATEEEREEFFEILARPDSDLLMHTLQEYWPATFKDDQLPSESSERILHSIIPISEKEEKQPVIRKIRWVRYAAAVVLFLVAGWTYYFIRQPHFTPDQYSNTGGNGRLSAVLPGHSGAILTLSNGQSVMLDTAGNGLVAEGFSKSAEVLSVDNVQEVYAKIETPFGRQQQVILSDGTKVWLNAGSSLAFPTRFSGKERKVSITGEVYFEVAHNASQPFIVNAAGEDIKVLGTHFNITAYDKNIATTLLEGSVEINGKTRLKPGEQYLNGVVSKADTEAAVAWVHGYFYFNRASLQTVLQQLARWYNLEIRYEGDITPSFYGGQIQKSLNLSEAFELLSITGVNYSLEGNILTIKQ